MKSFLSFQSIFLKVDELCRKFNNLTHDLMDSSIAEDLQLESSKNATEKVNTVIKVGTDYGTWVLGKI